jgi:hypothetical protein
MNIHLIKTGANVIPYHEQKSGEDTTTTINIDKKKRIIRSRQRERYIRFYIKFVVTKLKGYNLS